MRQYESTNEDLFCWVSKKHSQHQYLSKNKSKVQNSRKQSELDDSLIICHRMFSCTYNAYSINKLVLTLTNRRKAIWEPDERTERSDRL